MAVDDHRASPMSRCCPTSGATAPAFCRALRWFRARGVRVRRVMTDNGSCYRRRAFRHVPGAAPAPSGPGPTRRGPTARPSASSRPCCGSGPTRGPTIRRPIAPRAAGLAGPLQLRPAAYESRRAAAHESVPGGEQPHDSSHLVQRTPVHWQHAGADSMWMQFSCTSFHPTFRALNVVVCCTASYAVERA